MTTQTTLPTLSMATFDKKVEQEFAYLTWLQRMPEPQARAQARKTIETQYIRSTQSDV